MHQPLQVKVFDADQLSAADIERQLHSCQLLRDPANASMFRQVMRYKELNKVQGRCVEQIFNNRSNMLLNSPTGSGKTHLFEMAMLREYLLAQNKADFHVIVVAPIKSLCSELQSTWSAVFAPLVVTEFNSDFFAVDRETEHSEINRSNVLICTPEKFSMIMKRPTDFLHLLSSLSLLVVDELHLLDDAERGPSLESGLARLKLFSEKHYFGLSHTPVRLICASATFTNGDQICEWLDVPRGNFLSFSEDFRPVPINKYVYGYPSAASHYLFENLLTYKVASVIEKFAYGKSTLVFCATQKSAQKTAEEIVKQSPARQFIRNEAHLQDLNRASAGINDPGLKMCLMNGVGFHSAGLDQYSRREVERLFREGILNVLCTTSTLAQGVNLPAYLVIIKGTKAYRGKDKGFDEYRLQEILQMIGRAGRPQFESNAVGVVMTEVNQVQYYQSINNQQMQLSSHYMGSILDDLATEISLGTVLTLKCAVQYFKSTFFYIRCLKGSQKVIASKGLNGTEIPNGDFTKHIEAFIKGCLDQLCELGLLGMNGENYVSTNALREITRQSISISALQDVLKNPSMVFLDSPETYLRYLSNSTEFLKLGSKLHERKDLNDLNEKVIFPLKKSVCTPDRKIWVLLQVHMQRIKATSFELKLQNINHFKCVSKLWELQIEDIATTSVRLLKCLFKIFIDQKQLGNALSCHRFLMQLRRQINPADKTAMLRQLSGLDERTANDLMGAKPIPDLQTLSDLPQSVFFEQGLGTKRNKLLGCLPHLQLVTTTAPRGKTAFHVHVSAKVARRCSHAFHMCVCVLAVLLSVGVALSHVVLLRTHTNQTLIR